jgi:two-component system nitrate/nitrite response regulator NarL
MRKINFVSIVQPSDVYGEWLRRILGKAGFRIVDVWRTVDEAIAQEAGETRIDAILIDAIEHDETFADAIAALRRRFPGVRIALIAESLDKARVLKAMQADIDGLVLRAITGPVLVKSLELIAMGERVFPPSSLELLAWQESERSAGGVSLGRLSVREVDVVNLLSNGSSNKVIARELGISEATVKVHVKAILRKTGARNRTEVALLSRGQPTSLQSRLI